MWASEVACSQSSSGELVCAGYATKVQDRCYIDLSPVRRSVDGVRANRVLTCICVAASYPAHVLGLRVAGRDIGLHYWRPPSWCALVDTPGPLVRAVVRLCDDQVHVLLTASSQERISSNRACPFALPSCLHFSEERWINALLLALLQLLRSQTTYVMRACCPGATRPRVACF